MKIGIFDPYLDDLGGGEKYMMTIASCLAKKHTVSVFWDNPQDVKDIEQRFGIDFSHITIKKNIFASNVSLSTKLLTTRQYDAIIYLSDGSLPLVLSKKLYVHIQQPLEKIRTNSLQDKIKLAKISLFFCNSSYTKNFISQKIHKKIEILYPPVFLNPKDKKKENVILHVGRFRTKNVRLDDYKKQFVMVNAFKQMVDNGLKNWKFYLAVSIKNIDKEAFQNLQNLAKGYPIAFYINKTNNELWDLYSTAKIYWHASGFGEDLEKHPEYAEHFGISTVEAMGAGCVPVVINSGGQREIVQDNINGLLWNTLDELQQKTSQLIKNEKEMKKLSDAAKKRATYFSGDRFCNEVNTMFT